MDFAKILALAALSGLVPGAALPQARSLRPAHAISVIFNLGATRRKPQIF